MKLRQATEADQQVLRELWEEFDAEIPAPPEFVETWDEEWKDVAADIGGRGVVYLAEDDDGVAGAVRATMLSGHVWHIVFAHVRRREQRRERLAVHAQHGHWLRGDGDERRARPRVRLRACVGGLRR